MVESEEKNNSETKNETKGKNDFIETLPLSQKGKNRNGEQKIYSVYSFNKIVIFFCFFSDMY